jgi:hypothetical protein
MVKTVIASWPDAPVAEHDVVILDNTEQFPFTDDQLHAFASGAWWAMKAAYPLTAGYLHVLAIAADGVELLVLGPGSWGGPELVGKA